MISNGKKNKKSKMLAIALSVGLITNSLSIPFSNYSYADEGSEEEVVEEVPAESPIENAGTEESDVETNEEEDDSTQSENSKEGTSDDSAVETEGKEGEKKPESSSIADVISAEESTLSNDSIYRIRIGYEFDDGSFDEWATGTGFLVGNKYIVTTQTLADVTTTSPLFQRIVEEKSAGYTKAGVSLSDAATTEKHIKIKVYDTAGKEKTISSSIAESGIGVIVINQPEPSIPAVFEDADKLDVSEGNTFNIKYTLKSNSKSDVEEVSSLISSEKEGNKESTFGLTVEEDLSNQTTLGSPVLNEQGNVVGMVMIHGDVITAIQGNVLQTFLTNNGISFNTASTLKNKKDKEAQEQSEKEVDSAVKSNLVTTNLEKAIADAEAVEREKYVAESLAALDEVVEKGKEVLKDEEKTQAQIDAATDNIKKSIEGLVVDDSTFIDKHKGLFYALIGVVTLGAVFLTIKKAKQKEVDKQEEKALKKAKEAEEFDSGEGLSELLGTKTKSKDEELDELGDLDEDDDVVPEGFDDLVDDYNSKKNKPNYDDPYIDKVSYESDSNYNNVNNDPYDKYNNVGQNNQDVNYSNQTRQNESPYPDFGDPYAEDYNVGQANNLNKYKRDNDSYPQATNSAPRLAKNGYDDQFFDEGLDVTNQVAPKNLSMSRYKNIDGIDYVKPEYDEDEVVSDLSKVDPYGIEGAAVYKDQGDGDDETTILNNGPYLVRVDNGKQIPVHNNFIIGKQKKKVNYCITGNSSISREHARIRVINGDYCLEDLKSKNYTYVEGKQIPAYSPVKLKDGMTIRLSDVEFVFHQN